MRLTRWWATRWAAMKTWRERTVPRGTGHALTKDTSHRLEREEIREELYLRIGPIVTHGLPGQHWGMRPCLCAVCNRVRLCTPDFDFYVTHSHDGLVCHDCFYGAVMCARPRDMRS